MRGDKHLFSSATIVDDDTSFLKQNNITYIPQVESGFKFTMPLVYKLI